VAGAETCRVELARTLVKGVRERLQFPLDVPVQVRCRPLQGRKLLEFALQAIAAVDEDQN
jgi:hypothetical protein